MCEIGDYIVTRNSGICRIARIEMEKTSGKPDAIILTGFNTTDQSQKILADSDEILRKIISKEDLEDILSRIPYIRTIQAPNNKILEELYEAAMRQYDELEWIRVIKTAYLRKEEKRQMPFEEKYSKTAKDYFHGEVSILMEIPINKVESYIADAIAEDLW